MSQPAAQSAYNRLVFPAGRQVSFEGFTLPALGPGQVRVRAVCSLMSTGTENIVFNRLFAPDTHWDKWVVYPFFPGYSLIGVIEAVGADVTGFAIGETVAVRGSHASHHVIDASLVYHMPQGLPPEQAAWFSLAKIGFVGARAAEYRMGDDILVIGAGPIGQMAVRWARALGCRRVAVVDPVAGRLALATAGGATATISEPIAQAGPAVRAALPDGPRVVVDSTGNAAVFAAALGLVADRGRVVLLGDTGSPGDQRLTSDVITRGITVVGAHDLHVDARWNNTTILAFFFELLAQGRFPLDGLVTHPFPPDRAADAYALANARRGETMGIVFDWTTKLPQAPLGEHAAVIPGKAAPPTVR